MSGSSDGAAPRDLDAEALARVLEGRSIEEADANVPAAQARAEADVAALRRAFSVLGDALAADEPATDDAVAVPLAARRSQRGPQLARYRRPGGGMLAAAASLVAVVGLGAVVLNNSGEEQTRVFDAAISVQEPAARLDNPEAQDATAGAAALSEAPATAKRAPAGVDSPAEAVACARAIVIGKVVEVIALGDQVRLTLDIKEWIVPASGADRVQFAIGSRFALTDQGEQALTFGQRWLFVIPKATTSTVHAFVGPDYDAARARLREAQAAPAGRDCR